MSWKYGILKVQGGYRVCEVFMRPDRLEGHTKGVTPCGETKQELLLDLIRMANDVAQDIHEGRCLEGDDV